MVNAKLKTPLRLLNKLIAHVHFLEPRENTKQRVISSMVMIPLALYAIFYSANFFIFLFIAIAMMMTVEWLDMIRREENQTKWRTIGLFYILIPIYSVIKIRMIDSNILFWMFAVIWATDIFAFFAGRSLGGPKIAPNISPNKTWSGLAGGLIASMIIGLLSSFMFKGGILFFLVASIFLSLLEQASDLLESKFKRIFGVKDSGNLIPGHGGVLDRLDGMMLVAPMVLFLIAVFPSRFGM
ncbi:MAG: phosphatidate cytidylyltransferase [Proteobacteria bacterium]|nr:phosphatidate cytidylyltransferase [Pseudomonadota bacterium]